MSDHVHAHPGKSGGWFRYVPYFLFVLILYLAGAAVKDPRIALFSVGTYQLSWIEILLIVASIVALIEQLKVSSPGIDNTLEALTMVGMGVVQLVLYVLGAAGVGVFRVFNNTEFLELTVISLAAAVVAVLINARTLRRSIDIAQD